MPRVAIIGAGGQLGRELRLRLGENALPLLHADMELTDAASIRSTLERLSPAAVINAAAYNLVDQAESDPQAALQVNAAGVGMLARECLQREIPCVHVSTDYVFGADTNRTIPYAESDQTGPVNAYGVSKLAGEMLVRIGTPQHLIVRTCGLYGQPNANSKGNFVRTIQKLALSRDEISVVNDQRCTPTSAADLAAAILELLDSGRWGTYHATNRGDCSWYDLAVEVVKHLGSPTRVVPCTSAQFPRPARRPGYSVLDCSRLEKTIGRPLPNWREAVANYLRSSDPESSASISGR
ncbi:MAG: dTDP-4-dehydrorhamnose reductase [Planctomycetaceae bacterium]